jgi:hypothetical protein
MGVKDLVLASSDLATREVEVPEWKTTLTVTELGLGEGMQLAAMYGNGEKVTLTGRDVAQVVAWGVVDPETGERVFSDADVPKLARKSRHALMRLFSAIGELSSADGFEEAEKN